MLYHFAAMRIRHYLTEAPVRKRSSRRPVVGERRDPRNTRMQALKRTIHILGKLVRTQRTCVDSIAHVESPRQKEPLTRPVIHASELRYVDRISYSNLQQRAAPLGGSIENTYFDRVRQGLIPPAFGCDVRTCNATCDIDGRHLSLCIARHTFFEAVQKLRDDVGHAAVDDVSAGIAAPTHNHVLRRSVLVSLYRADDTHYTVLQDNGEDHRRERRDQRDARYRWHAAVAIPKKMMDRRAQNVLQHQLVRGGEGLCALHLLLLLLLLVLMMWRRVDGDGAAHAERKCDYLPAHRVHRRDDNTSTIGPHRPRLEAGTATQCTTQLVESVTHILQRAVHLAEDEGTREVGVHDDAQTRRVRRCLRAARISGGWARRGGWRHVLLLFGGKGEPLEVPGGAPPGKKSLVAGSTGWRFFFAGSTGWHSTGCFFAGSTGWRTTGFFCGKYRVAYSLAGPRGALARASPLSSVCSSMCRRRLPASFTKRLRPQALTTNTDQRRAEGGGPNLLCCLEDDLLLRIISVVCDIRMARHKVTELCTINCLHGDSANSNLPINTAFVVSAVCRRTRELVRSRNIYVVLNSLRANQTSALRIKRLLHASLTLMVSSLQTLSIKNNRLSPGTFSTLIRALTQARVGVTSINASYVRLGDVDLERLNLVLPLGCTSIRHLNVSVNTIHSMPALTRAFPMLTSLSLDNNTCRIDLSDAHACLPRCLTSLSLCDNHWFDADCVQLLDAANLPHLRDLKLTGTFIADVTSSPEGMQAWRRLVSRLSVLHVEVAAPDMDTGDTLMKPVMHAKGIEELRCRGDKAVCIITRALRRSTSLLTKICTLDLSLLNMSDDSFVALIDAATPLGTFMNIEDLNLNNNLLTKVAVRKLLASCSSTFPKLRTLDLSFNRVGNLIVVDAFRRYKKEGYMTTIKTLRCNYCGIGNSCMRHLIRLALSGGLARHLQFDTIELRENKISNKFVATLTRALLMGMPVSNFRTLDVSHLYFAEQKKKLSLDRAVSSAENCPRIIVM